MGRDGWQRRAAQVAALVVWLATAAGFFALFVPVLEPAAWRSSAAAAYAVATAAALASYLVVSLTDPADNGNEGPLYCDQCRAFVQRGSRHCAACAKCIAGFDHHCKWLHTCIGRANYRPFLGLLTSAVALLALQLAAGVHLLVGCFSAPAAAEAALAGLGIGRQAYAATLCVCLGVVAPLLYMLADLWLLHLVLAARGLTTWDYISVNRDAALAAAASKAGPGAGGARPSAASRAWHLLRAAGPRSGRVRDEPPQLPLAAGGAPGAAPAKPPRVALSPCLACRTQLGERRAGAAYAGSSLHGGGFDAALLVFTPRMSAEAAQAGCEPDGPPAQAAGEPQGGAGASAGKHPSQQGAVLISVHAAADGGGTDGSRPASLGPGSPAAQPAVAAAAERLRLQPQPSRSSVRFAAGARDEGT